MSLDGQLRRTNRNMIAFDLVLGSGALLAPSQTLRVLGHDEPSDDAKELFRRCGPIWLTFAAAHLVAYRRNRAEGLVGAVLAARHGARDRHRLVALAGVLAARAPGPGSGSPGLSNLAMTLGFAYLSQTES